jgi:hypothetical protein
MVNTTFERPALWPKTRRSCTTKRPADLNNEKILDLAVSNAFTNNVDVLLGIGNGDFKCVQTFSTGTNSAPYTVVIGDFNNDGLPDLVTGKNGTGDVTVLLNRCSSLLY